MRHAVVCAALLACLIATAAAIAQSPTAPNVPVTPATTESAREVLARVRPSVIQIKGFFGANTAQAFHGTGFAVAPAGVFLTNYHVVARHVRHPTRYRLEFRTPDERTGPVAVLAVDVRNDLALVTAESHAPEPLKLISGADIKGERAYSVGYPLDVGLTITEGVSNGRVENSFEPRIHYSGAINAGMSGGPALNASGDVIGINVSGYRFQQLVSFLVPAEHAVALRDRAIEKSAAPPAKQPDAEQLKGQIAAGLRAHSAALLHALANPVETQSTAGYRLPSRLAPFIDCNATGNADTDQPVQTVRTSCSAKAARFVHDDLQAGDIRYSHTVLNTTKLDAWRFTHRLSSGGFGGIPMIAMIGGFQFGSWRHVGRYACESRIVTLKGFDANLTVCARGYRKLEGLYDFAVRINSLNGKAQGFNSQLDLTGLEYEPSMAFIRRFVEAMEWRAAEAKP